MSGAPRHYMTGTRIHNQWKGMLSRCLNKNNRSYKNYGGRGVTVCDRWLVFENFLEDMGPGYRDDLTIERVNNDKGYEPENCRWLEKKFQSRNRRNPKRWDFKKSGISTNTSGIRGVCWDKSRSAWIATICVGRKQKNLGRFATAEEAGRAYQKASLDLRGHP